MSNSFDSWPFAGDTEAQLVHEPCPGCGKHHGAGVDCDGLALDDADPAPLDSCQRIGNGRTCLRLATYALQAVNARVCERCYRELPEPYRVGAKRLPTAPAELYRGARTDSGALVWKLATRDATPEPLPPRHDIRNHSPTGYEWGYGGSGPAQLALALTLDVLGGNVARTRRVYQTLKWRVVAHIPATVWELTGEYLAGQIEEIEWEQSAEGDAF